MKRFALTVIIFAIPMLAGAQESGGGIIQGGTGGWASIPLSSAAPTSSFSLYGWGGFFTSRLFEIGPYISVTYSSTQNNATQNGSWYLDVSPGFQAGMYFSFGDAMPFLRDTTAVELSFQGSSSSGQSTSDSSVPGFWTELNAGLALRLNPSVSFSVGPTFNLYYSLQSDTIYYTLGFDLGLLFFFPSPLASPPGEE